jgi:hypothetical protein
VSRGRSRLLPVRVGGAGAEGLGREGAAVLCTDLDAAAAGATAERIRAAGGRAISSGLDVRDRAAVGRRGGDGGARS